MPSSAVRRWYSLSDTFLPLANIAALILLCVSGIRNGMAFIAPWFFLFACGRIITWVLRMLEWQKVYWWAEMILLPLRLLICSEALSMLTEARIVSRRERLWMGFFGVSVGAVATLPVISVWWPADPSRTHYADLIRQITNILAAGFMAGILFYSKISRYIPSRAVATEHAMLLMCYFFLISGMSLVQVRTFDEWRAVDTASSSGTLAMFVLWFAILRPRTD